MKMPTLAALAALSVPSDGAAQAICFPAASLSEVVAQTPFEVESSPTINVDGHMMQGFVLVDQNGTWLLFLVDPGGIACAIMHGIDWHNGEPA